MRLQADDAAKAFLSQASLPVRHQNRQTSCRSCAASGADPQVRKIVSDPERADKNTAAELPCSAQSLGCIGLNVRM
jgi:hypothetical protein